MQMSKFITFKLLMPAAFFFLLFGALASAQPVGCTGWDSSGNGMLTGNYYIRHVTWQVGDAEGDLVVLGWGSTYGPIREAVKHVRAKGKKVSHVHLRYLNPLPRDLEETLKRFKQVMIPEMNMGQLLKMIRADYLIDAFGFNKIQGRPFKVSEIENRINRALEG